MTLNQIAEHYVKLVLAVGQHDAGYVDAYIGPPSWQNEAQQSPATPLSELLAQADALLQQADALPRRHKISLNVRNFYVCSYMQ
jgi:hypothetical protein